MASSSSSSSSSWWCLHLLKQCSNERHLTQVHAKLIRSFSLQTQKQTQQQKQVATNLLRLYASFNRLDYATRIFHQIDCPSTFAWNLLIRAHSLNSCSTQALLFFHLMASSSVPPDHFTLPFVINACAASSSIHTGRQLHALALKTGFYATDIFVKNTLLHMYLKCGHLNLAHKLFDQMSLRTVVSWTTMLSGLVSSGDLDSATAFFHQMPHRNVVSWTTIIDAYVAKGKPQDAFELFSEMQVQGVMPNEFTLVCLLRACTQLGSVDLGVWVHEYALKNGFQLGVYLGTALVDMYSKCGSLVEARKVFDMMEERSLATWNSMITSLGVHGCGEEALELYEQMNIAPDAITFVGVLSACVQTQKVDQGLGYFKHMTQNYGIMPVLEHYMCMFVLWALDKSRQEEVRIMAKKDWRQLMW